MKKLIKNNVNWIGHIDWDLQTFHGEDYSILNGSSQNAYLIQEEKNVLIDTVWAPHRFEFIENLKTEIDLHKIDYIIANHGEIDHSGALPALMEEIPNTPIYCTANAVKSIEGQYGKKGWNFKVVKTGDSLDIGNGKKLIFIEMRMLHWPDSMGVYLTKDNILFSNDMFGQHFAIEELFTHKADKCRLMHEALKYYANILNPFSLQAASKIKEIAQMGLDIDIIAPSHGAVWKNNPQEILDLYAKWSDNYMENQVTVCFDTMWEGTAKIAYKIASEIAKQSPDTVVRVFNIAKSDKNEIMTEIFKSKAIAVGSPTECNSILPPVAGWLTFLKMLKFKNKKAAAFGCYGWSGESVKILKQKLAESGFNVIDNDVKANWNPNDDDFAKIPDLVKNLLD